MKNLILLSLSLMVSVSSLSAGTIKVSLEDDTIANRQIRVKAVYGPALVEYGDSTDEGNNKYTFDVNLNDNTIEEGPNKMVDLYLEIQNDLNVPMTGDSSTHCSLPFLKVDYFNEDNKPLSFVRIIRGEFPIYPLNVQEVIYK